MAVAADHVGDGEFAGVDQRAAKFAQQAFEIDDVVEGLIGENGVVTVSGLPLVEISLEEGELLTETGGLGRGTSTSEHVRIQVQTFEDEIVVALGAELRSQGELKISVPCPNAEKAAGSALGTLAAENVEK